MVHHAKHCWACRSKSLTEENKELRKVLDELKAACVDVFGMCRECRSFEHMPTCHLGKVLVTIRGEK